MPYVHGRRGQKELLEATVILFSESLEVAKQYAGHSGSVWELVSWKGAKVFDWRNTNERETLAEDLVARYFAGTLPQAPREVLEVEEAEADGDEARLISTVADSLAVTDIVNHAGWLDNYELVNFLWETYEVDIVFANNGCGVLNKAAVSIVKAYDVGDEMAEDRYTQNFISRVGYIRRAINLMQDYSTMRYRIMFSLYMEPTVAGELCGKFGEGAQDEISKRTREAIAKLYDIFGLGFAFMDGDSKPQRIPGYFVEAVTYRKLQEIYDYCMDAEYKTGWGDFILTPSFSIVDFKANAIVKEAHALEDITAVPLRQWPEIFGIKKS